MRVSFDSNAWEEIFRSDAQDCIVIREALATRKFEGLICETAFRIEAVRKKDRTAYFAQPRMEVSFPGSIVQRDGKPHIVLMSIGPDNRQHPGLPEIQAERLKLAVSAGIRLMRELAWMGLPCPPEINDPRVFLQETEHERAEREQCQMAICAGMWERGVGKQAFDAAGGWQEDGRLSIKANFMKRSLRRPVLNGLTGSLLRRMSVIVTTFYARRIAELQRACPFLTYQIALGSRQNTGCASRP